MMTNHDLDENQVEIFLKNNNEFSCDWFVKNASADIICQWFNNRRKSNTDLSTTNSGGEWLMTNLSLLSEQLSTTTK